ncbi:MAG TPA: porin family protein, partial [Bradyrhizobium sp.]|nr:porin family protein [Bradyrhizobium sp.]
MRRFLLTAVMAMMASGAQAADMPDFLRGSLLPSTPAPTVNWQGFYVGGQGGVGESDMNFTGATQSIAAKLLANTAIENSGGVSSWPVG